MADDPPRDWQDLMSLAQGAEIVVERVRLKDRGVALEGAWAPPDLARLSAQDQVFVAAFLRAHGSIKEVEQVFGVSYPTIKARLNRIAAQFEFVHTATTRPSRGEILDRLSRGEIDAEMAIAELEASKNDA
jgi:hypothetical protein